MSKRPFAKSKEGNLKSLIWIAVLLGSLTLVLPGNAQQIDVSFAGSSISSPSSNFVGNPAVFLPSERGGAFVGFNGDVLFHGHLGVQAEINWKASQGDYIGLAGYRPLLYSFNAIYAKRFSKQVGAEVLGGIGAESIRFYTGQSSCDYYGNCTNYTSSNHFLVNFGGGVRLYAWHNFFVRPEMRFYIVHNNQEFSSDYIVRYGASVGYTFGGEH
jgi:hypothetical protein